MSKIQVNEIVNHFDNGAPDCPKGFTVSSGISTFTGSIDANGSLDVDGHTNLDNVNISGVVTATSFVGNVTGNVTGNADSATNAQGLTGSPSISVASLVATGNVTIGGTLTYDDVTNVDVIGILTARGGIKIGTGGTVGPVGSGIVTYFGDGSQLTGIDATQIQTGNTSVQTIDTGSDGHVKVNTEGSERLRITSTGLIDASSNTTAIALPQGTTAQRPSGSAPYIRKNTTNNALEYFDGTSWVEIITDYFPTGSTILG
tara:strand:- start:1220 stop:1996 length:777 start_codon:yes stop_codon:yes gene_type:complete